jgi:hypothetical protein
MPEMNPYRSSTISRSQRAKTTRLMILILFMAALLRLLLQRSSEEILILKWWPVDHFSPSWCRDAVPPFRQRAAAWITLKKRWWLAESRDLYAFPYFEMDLVMESVLSESI